MAPPAKSDDLDDLVGQVVEEYFQRVEQGQRPQLDEFAERYPEISGLLKKVIPALQAAEQTSDKSANADPAREYHKQLGDFRILRQIGRGGMGIVYEAEQISMTRRVALKVLPLAGLVDELKIRRFQNEVRAVAALDHPNIVSVYTVGDERGVHYYAMQLIRGRSLSEVISSLRRVRDAGERLDSSSIGHITSMGGVENGGESDVRATREPVDNDTCEDVTTVPVDTAAPAEGSTIPGSTRREYYRSVAALGIQACSALQHAHDQGVIHRDIKPSNLLLDGSSKLYLTDFGLARIEADVGVTMTGDLIGTLRYMAPEQALAKRVTVDHRADIYSLAATLYELFTLQPAYLAEDRQQLLRQIAFEEPTPLRRIDREIPTELDTIIHKAMSKDMDQRYTSAQALADDLRLHLENRPIKAKPPTTSEIIGKWTRRNPSLTWAAFITLSLVSLTLAVSTLLISKQLAIASKAQESEKLAREEATLQTSKLSRRVYLMHLANADRALVEKEINFPRARLELDDCPQEHRGWEWRFLDKRMRATIPQMFRGAEQPIFTRDGKRLIAIGALGTPDQRMANIWDLSSGGHVRALKHDAPLSHIAMSPDEKRIAGGDYKGKLFVWEFATGKKLWSGTEHTAKFDGLAFSPDGSLIAGANHDKTFKVFDATNGQVRHTFGPFEESLRKVVFSPDGRWISSAGIYGQIQAMIIDVATGEITALFPGEGHMIPTFDPSGRRIATSNRDGSITLWDWDGNQPTVHQSWQATDHYVWALDFSADGNQLVSGNAGHGVNVWDVTTGNEGQQLDALDDSKVPASWLATAPWGGEMVAFFTAMHGIQVWRYGKDREELIVKPFGVPAAASFSPDGRQIVASRARENLDTRNVQRDAINQGQNVSVLDAASGTEVLEIEGNLHSASWTPDGRCIVAAADPQSEFRVYSSSTGELTHAITGDTFLFADFAQSGRRLDLVSIDGAVRVQDLLSGEENEVWNPGGLEEKGGLIAVDISPKHALVGVALGFNVEIWDVQNEKRVASFRIPGEWVRHLAFSQDGNDLYVGSGGGRLTGFDIDSGAAKRFTSHAIRVSAIATSPDGDQIVSGDLTGRVIVWDVAHAQPIVTLTDVGQPIVSLDWSSDGRRIVAGKEDGSIQIWTLPRTP